MCEPTSVALVAGAVLKGAGSVMGGKAKKQALYDEASQVNTEARVKARNIRKLADEVRGAARAGYAASGVMVDEGSPLVVDEYITRESELDALYTLVSGEQRAKSLKQTGSAAETAGYIGLGETALSAYGDWASLDT